MNHSWLEIFDECLTRIQSGELTVEDCLQEHPQFAEEFAHVLGIAKDTHVSLVPPGPEEVFASTSPVRVINRMRIAQRRRVQPRQRRILIPRLRLRWALKPVYAVISLAIAIGLLSLSAGVAWASTDALPGDSLYGVKRAVEQGRLALTWSSAGDAALLEKFAGKRIAEIESLIAAGREADIDVALEGYEDVLDQLMAIAAQVPPSDGPGSLEHILENLDRHTQTLTRVLGQVPLAAQKGITNAILKSQHGREVIIEVRQGGSPSELAPGQLKKTEEAQNGQEEQEKGKPPTKTPKPKPEKKKSPGPPKDTGP